MNANENEFSCGDPTIQADAHAILTQLWPNLPLMSLPEFTLLFSDLLRIGAGGHAGGRALTADFAARLVAAFEHERERRGFASYRDLAETAVAVHQENLRDRERACQVH